MQQPATYAKRVRDCQPDQAHLGKLFEEQNGQADPGWRRARRRSARGPRIRCLERALKSLRRDLRDDREPHQTTRQFAELSERP